MAQKVGLPVLKEGKAHRLGKTPELRARLLRRLERHIGIAQLRAPALASEVRGQGLLRYHLSPRSQL